MDKAHPLSTPMVVRSLDTKKDPYRPKGDDEMVLGPEVPYLSAIGALMYLAQCTGHDIAFSVNLLAEIRLLLQQADIGPALNIFYDIFVERQTWAYSIPVN
ncbi:unnamed protein product [Prunus brigantina]